MQLRRHQGKDRVTTSSFAWHPSPGRPREAFVADLPDELYDYWVGDYEIAQLLEVLMIAHALLARPHEFRGRQGIWMMIDNVAGLMCLLRGRSDSLEVEESCHFIHVPLFALTVSLHWEYIPSKPNWADPISRLGSQDPCFPPILTTGY